MYGLILPRYNQIANISSGVSNLMYGKGISEKRSMIVITEKDVRTGKSILGKIINVGNCWLSLAVDTIELI